LIDLGGPTETTTDSKATATALAVYAHEDLSIGELHLLPGARVEAIRTQLTTKNAEPGDPVLRATLLPGFAVLYGLGDNIDVFGGVHRGFSPVAPGQPLEVAPETSWNYEVGGRWSNADRHAELVGFFNDYQNLTGTCTLSGGCDGGLVGNQFNGGEVWVTGVEATAGITVRLPVALTIPVSASYAWTHAVFRTGFSSDFPQFGTVEAGDSLPYVPRHQGNARVTLQHERWSLSLGATARSGMLNQAGTFPVDDNDVAPLLLLDAAGNLDLGERFVLYATGTNLTNSKGITSWRPFGARPTAPLLVMVGLKLKPPSATPQD
jgi:Fe(3+) dicitrate transport protein